MGIHTEFFLTSHSNYIIFHFSKIPNLQNNTNEIQRFHVPYIQYASEYKVLAVLILIMLMFHVLVK